MKKRLLLVLVLLLVASAYAQFVDGTGLEDFESYSGEIPVGTVAQFYTFRIPLGEVSDSGEITSSSCPTIGSGQCLRLNRDGSTQPRFRFVLHEEKQLESIRFVARWGAASSEQFRFIINGPTLSESDIVAGFIFQRSGGAATISHNDDSCDNSNIVSIYTGNTGNTEVDFRVELQWEPTKRYTVFVDDVEVADRAFNCSSVDAVEDFFWTLTGASGPSIRTDDYIVQGAAIVAVVEEVEPAEFDEGLQNFLASQGFVTPESQLFFVLLVTGPATVAMAAALQWISSGRIKNTIIVIAPFALAVFSFFFGFIQLWVVMTATVLGAAFTQGGASDMRNTWSEIRDRVRDRGSKADAATDTAADRVQGIVAREQAMRDVPDASAVKAEGEASESKPEPAPAPKPEPAGDDA